MNIAFYGRVSTASQAERDLSLPDQDQQVEAWARDNGHIIVAKYVDAGKSATNGRRPEFQRMIADATSGHAPFQGIAVHSLSRFYRDQTELMLHVRELKRFGIRLLSVTQATSEDFTGDMIMRMISMFDEFSSKENAKHVLRTMLKNAKDGYFNGSTVPFGYCAVELPILGCKGRHRKKLEINPEEAKLVEKAFELYVSRDMGVKDLVSHFNTEGTLRRGKQWCISTMHRMLVSPVYIGQKPFNQKHWESGKAKPQEEVVISTVPAIITEEMFILTGKKLQERSPKKSHPRVISSPNLLTGLLKCGKCGASMIMATGKNNTYFYYRCSTKSQKGVSLCDSKAVRMDKLDRLVLECLANKVLTPERVTTIIRELKKRVHKNGANLNDLTKQLEVVQHKLKNLYNAIADGLINSTDPILAEQLETLQQQRGIVESKITQYQNTADAMIQEIDSQQVKQFTGIVQRKLMDTASKLPKEYLKLFLKEVIVDGSQVKLIGDPTKMACAVKIATKTKNLSTSDEVLRFNVVWRAWRDSNSRPTDS